MGNDSPATDDEIQSRLQTLNLTYSALVESRNPPDDKREAFRQARLWFEDRRIKLQHLKPNDPWLLA